MRHSTTPALRFLLLITPILLALNLFGFSSSAKVNTALSTSLVPAGSDTEDGTDLPILAGKNIRVVDWQTQSQTYILISVEYPGEGTSHATPHGMTRGLHALNEEELRKNPQSIVGKTFVTDAELPTLFAEEVEARRSTPKRKSRK